MSRALAIVATHPIQYNAPLFRAVASREDLEVRVFYNWVGATETAYDPGFESDIEWDIPLLKGYDSTFVPNTAADPGTHHFRGLVNPELVPRIETWGPDAILVYGWAYQSHLRVLWSFSGRVPVFFRGDSTLLDEDGGVRTILRRAVLRQVYRMVDVALYVGTNNKAYFRAQGFGEEDLHWAPHAVENTRFADSTGEYGDRAAAWRSELGIPEEDMAVLFAGKLGQKKAPDLLLDAYDRVAHQGLHLVFVGSGPMEGELRKRAAKDEHIHFLGFQNQSRMPIVYRLGDVFVLPSRSETWGLAVNEAMASGRPVLVSDRVGCAPDLVDDGTNGFVCEAGSALSLARRLRTLLKAEDRLNDMGRCSLERIQDWSIQEEADRIGDAIHQHL